MAQESLGDAEDSEGGNTMTKLTTDALIGGEEGSGLPNEDAAADQKGPSLHIPPVVAYIRRYT